MVVRVLIIGESAAVVQDSIENECPRVVATLTRDPVEVYL